MNTLLTKSVSLALLLGMAGCASLEPRQPEADAGIPASWPVAPAEVAGIKVDGYAATGSAVASETDWRAFFLDAKLEQVIAQALENNRDLRVAILNVERVRAQYRIQRSERLPSLGVNAQLQRSGGDNLSVADVYSVGIGLANFELDLFGRVRNLSEAALQRYLAQEETRHSAQLSLIAEVANAYLTLAADRELQGIAQATFQTYEESHGLTEKRYELGGVSALDLSQSRTLVEAARSDVAQYAGRVAADTNALTLLVGAPVAPDLLPKELNVDVSGLVAVPAGLPSDVLLRRPDVQAAEHLLRGANANIGAARAAFFPSISLTGSVGSASNELSGLFESGSKMWNFMPQINIPIFQGGRLRANLGMATADRDIALAQYEKAIQTSFREVADALAFTRTLAAQRVAQEALVAAATRADELSRARYDAGMDSYLTLLVAQRTLYTAKQSLLTTQLAEQSNRVTLYKVLGGGWKEGEDS